MTHFVSDALLFYNCAQNALVQRGLNISLSSNYKALLYYFTKNQITKNFS